MTPPRIVYDVPSSMVPDDVRGAVAHALAAAEADIGPSGEGQISYRVDRSSSPPTL